MPKDMVKRVGPLIYTFVLSPLLELQFKYVFHMKFDGFGMHFTK